MNPVILIPARMASTRLPDKPLADICGKPMIIHVWERAMESHVGPVVVACDDERILRVVKARGGDAVMTRSDHASGSDRIFEALTLIDPQKRYDMVVNVQGDVPTIEPALIRIVLAPLKNPAVDIATLACIIHTDKERKDPSVVKPVLKGAWGMMGHNTIAQAESFTREPALKRASAANKETAYHHIGIYAYRRQALEKFVSLPPSPLEIRDKLEQMRAIENGLRIDIALVDTVPLGVDTPEHLEQAREALHV